MEDRGYDAVESIRLRNIPKGIFGTTPEGKKFYSMPGGRSVYEGSKEFEEQEVRRGKLSTPGVPSLETLNLPSAATPSVAAIEESNKKFMEGMPAVDKSVIPSSSDLGSVSYPVSASGYALSPGGKTTIARDLEITRANMPVAPSRDQYRESKDGSMEYIGINPMYSEEMKIYEQKMAEREEANARIMEVVKIEKEKAKAEGRQSRSLDQLSAGAVSAGSGLFSTSAVGIDSSVIPASKDNDLAIVRGEIEASAAQRAEASARLMQYNMAKSPLANTSAPITESGIALNPPESEAFNSAEDITAPRRRTRARSGIDITDGLSLRELGMPSDNKGIMDDMRKELEEVGMKLRDVSKIDFAKISYDQLSKDFGEGFADVAKKAVQIALEEISKSRN